MLSPIEDGTAVFWLEGAETGFRRVTRGRRPCENGSFPETVPRTVAIVNPHAAGGRAAARWPRVARALEKRLGPIDARFTKEPNHASEIARQALGEGAELILAVGGDGTVNEIVNGMFFAGRPLRPGARLALAPFGTGGDLGRMVAMPTKPDALAVALSEGRAVPFDVGLIRLTGDDGKPVERYFLNLTSFGMGGAVSVRAKQTPLASLNGKLAFLWATVTVALGYKGRAVRLRLDGGEEDERRVTNIAVGNGRFHGGGMQPCPHARLDSGVFEVTVIDYLNLWELITGLPTLYSNDVYRHPKAHRYQARRVEAESDEPVRVEVDGEALGSLPLEITLLPGALPFVLPPRSPLLPGE